MNCRTLERYDIVHRKLLKVNVECRSLACCPTSTRVVNQWPENLQWNKICCLREPPEKTVMRIPDWQRVLTDSRSCQKLFFWCRDSWRHTCHCPRQMYDALSPPWASFIHNHTCPYKCHRLYRCHEARQSPPLLREWLYFTYLWFVGFDFSHDGGYEHCSLLRCDVVQRHRKTEREREEFYLSTLSSASVVYPSW